MSTQTATNNLAVQDPGASANATDPRNLTVIECAPSLALTKTFTPTETRPYDHAKHFNVCTVPLDGIEDLHACLCDLSAESSLAVLRDRLISEETAASRIERKGEGSGGPFCEQPRRWVCVDVDGAPCRPGFDVCDPSQHADEIAWAIETYLPSEFKGCACAYQWSSSAGMPGKDGLRAHLWFWLSRPLGGAECRCLLRRHATFNGAPVLDLGMYDAVRIHYTAAPQFLDGAIDPLPSCRNGLLPGQPQVIVPEVLAEQAANGSALSDRTPDKATVIERVSGWKLQRKETIAKQAAKILLAWEAGQNIVPVDNDERHTKLFGVVGRAVGEAWPQADAQVIADYFDGEGWSQFSRGKYPIAELARSIEWWQNQAQAHRDRVLICEPHKPGKTARTFTERFPNVRLLYRGGTLYMHDNSHWAPVEATELRSALREWLEDAVYFVDDKEIPYSPNRQNLAEVTAALEDQNFTPPGPALAWLCREPPCAIGNVIPLANGLLRLDTGDLVPHTPDLFNTFAVPIKYDPRARAPLWHRWLREMLPDVTARAALQELAGYLISGDTSQEKMFLLWGPLRSGKSTITEILRALVGEPNVAGIDLDRIGKDQFALAGLVGKALAVVEDSRQESWGPHMHKAAQVLLTITGRGLIPIPRKYADDLQTVLGARIVIVSNTTPKINDSSRALAERFVAINFPNSVLGREDPELKHRLLEELPGILLWAIRGLRRLRARGHFVQPLSSAAKMETLRETASTVTAFVADCCDLTTVDDTRAPELRENLYRRWRRWCESQGRHASNVTTFVEDLKAAFPHIKEARPGGHTELGRKRQVHGIRLIPLSEHMPRGA